jgi:hypothetical protein
MGIRCKADCKEGMLSNSVKRLVGQRYESSCDGQQIRKWAGRIDGVEEKHSENLPCARVYRDRKWEEQEHPGLPAVLWCRSP